MSGKESLFARPVATVAVRGPRGAESRSDAARWPRPLLVVATLTALTTVVLAVLVVVDHQTVTGAERWLKPLKFSVSITIYVLTLAWMSRLVRRYRRTALAMVGLGSLVMVVELGIIIAQAGRGRASHFNTATHLDARLFAVMGQMIALAWLATLVLALVLLREHVPGAGLRTGVRWGLGVTLLGMLAAAFMLEPLNRWAEARVAGPPSPAAGSHTIGALDGGPGLPVLGWSTIAGDLRIGHFVGLHALQVLPLLGWLLDRSTRWTDRQRRQLVRTGGAAWLGVVVLLVWQALRAESLIHPGPLTLVVGAGLIAAAAVVAVLVVRRPGPAAPAGPRPTDVPAPRPAPAA